MKVCCRPGLFAKNVVNMAQEFEASGKNLQSLHSGPILSFISFKQKEDILVIKDDQKDVSGLFL